MSIWIFVIVSIAVAACIGGLTNHLAIKMLFHPRRPIRIRGFTLPFTPGLIPKRKTEIARSLGRVVADYLVTSKGLLGVISTPEFRDMLARKLEGAARIWLNREETMQELLAKALTVEGVEEGKRKLAEWLRDHAEAWLLRQWTEGGWSRRTLKSLAPGWNEERREFMVDWAAGELLEILKREVDSPEGDRLLRRVMNEALNEAGGLLGSLAVIFMDPERTVQRLKAVVLRQLEATYVKQAVAGILMKQVKRLEDSTLEEAAGLLTEQPAEVFLPELLGHYARWEEWLDRFGGFRTADLPEERRARIMELAPDAARLLQKMLEASAEQIVQAVELHKLVENQVNQFPVERVEHIILNVSGREFRAITWLGAALGGLIGGLQSVFVLVFLL